MENNNCYSSVEMEKIDELYTAAESGNHAALPQLPGGNKIGTLLFTPIPPGGYTALHIAAYHGHKDFVEKLLALYYHEGSLDLEGRNNFLKAKDAYKNTALHEAVRGGDYPDIVRLLLGVDPTLAEKRNNDDKSPVFIAAENGHPNAVEALLDHARGKTPLHHIHKRSDGRTPLHHAMYRQQYEVVKTLSRNHELVKAEDIEGWTVLHVAASIDGCPEEIVEQLLELDISLSYKKDNINQRTALHIAATHGNLGFVRCILRIATRCADIVDKDGRHALHLAVEKGDVNTVVTVLQFMPRLINVLDNNGYTALDIAMERDDKVENLVVRTLRSYNGKQGVRKAQTPSQPRMKYSRQAEEQEINTLFLSVIAVLIATMSFQAVIHLLGGTNVLAHKAAFKHLMVTSAVAFFLSMSAVFYLFASAVLRPLFAKMQDSVAVKRWTQSRSAEPAPLFVRMRDSVAVKFLTQYARPLVLRMRDSFLLLIEDRNQLRRTEWNIFSGYLVTAALLCMIISFSIMVRILGDSNSP